MTTRAEFWRSLLILGRVSNLPTVWSNCLAGWLLGGAGSGWRLFDLCAGATFLYVGGMYLNDAVDVDFDRQHRRDRPIPAGHISVSQVWWLSCVLLGAGFLMLTPLGRSTAVLAVLLLITIIVYDMVHKWVSVAPVIMAGCRFWLLLAAASTGARGISGDAAWGAIVLALYIVGLSYLARRESLNSPVAWWPLVGLLSPVLLILLVNNGDYRNRAFFLALILIAWVFLCLRHAFWTNDRNVGRAVAGLLAGIPLVDLMAIGGGGVGMGISFTALFFGALLLQRYVPAT